MSQEPQPFELHFESRGEGRPLLLIHGFPFNHRMWESQIPDFARAAHVLAPDLPGFGESPPRDAPYSVQRYAADCLAILDALDILEPVVVCGLSLGGYIALAFARHFPERLAGLILAATRAGADSPEGKAGRDESISKVRAKGVGDIVQGMHPKILAAENYETKPELAKRLKEMMLRASSEGVAAALSAMRDRPDSTALLSKIQVPTLVIHGEEDQIIPSSAAKAMAVEIPGAELSLIPRAGHMLNLEQAELFNRQVKGFLAKI